MDAISRNWMAVLTGVLAVLYGYVGIGSGGVVLAAAIVGAVLILAALADLGLPRWTREAMLVVGALPLVALTWWSLVAPILAVLAIVVGSVAVRGGRAEPRTAAAG
jgi:hypothetical protein